jgi:exodeoxyribonuclease VII small subunit
VSDEPTGASYAEMLAELEAILAELESDDVDVDVLAVRVARAAELVEACRARIDRARMEVERVVASLAEADPPAAAPE